MLRTIEIVEVVVKDSEIQAEEEEEEGSGTVLDSAAISKIVMAAGSARKEVHVTNCAAVTGGAPFVKSISLGSVMTVRSVVARRPMKLSLRSRRSSRETRSKICRNPSVLAIGCVRNAKITSFRSIVRVVDVTMPP